MKIEIRQKANQSLDDALDQALKIFKKKTIGLVKEFRERKYFRKPSIIQHELERKIAHQRKLKRKKKR